ncbi:unnamed protein product [Ambrosiozyma monospora]|uniref:Unnamed protein product n=1 Tax=Ambrosiozyma monospora TaxID=43982 RepID=A0A9W6W8Q4_AMBMO|nr:unnamed protein product [Ambrosiozyma monospora]
MISKVFEKHNHHSPKTTHSFRRTCAQHCSDSGVPIDSIEMASGRGQSSKSTTNYIDTTRLDVVECVAGFSSREVYFIPRDIEAPDSLKNQIFPWLEDYRKKIPTGADGVYSLADQVLTTLEFLRKTLLQDVAVILDKHPDHIIGYMSPFNTVEFKRYAAQVVTAHSSGTLSGSDKEKLAKMTAVLGETGDCLSKLTEMVHNMASSQMQLMSRMSSLESVVDRLTNALNQANSRHCSCHDCEQPSEILSPTEVDVVAVKEVDVVAAKEVHTVTGGNTRTVTGGNTRTVTGGNTRTVTGGNTRTNGYRR